MARTATRKRSTKREKVKGPRIRVRDGIDPHLEWTPAEKRVYARRATAEIWEGGKRVADATLTEWGGKEGKDSNAIHLGLSADTEEGKHCGEICDPLTVHQLDLIIEVLVAVRARGREIGILPTT